MVNPTLRGGSWLTKNIESLERLLSSHEEMSAQLGDLDFPKKLQENANIKLLVNVLEKKFPEITEFPQSILTDHQFANDPFRYLVGGGNGYFLAIIEYKAWAIGKPSLTKPVWRYTNATPSPILPKCKCVMKILPEIDYLAVYGKISDNDTYISGTKIKSVGEDISFGPIPNTQLKMILSKDISYLARWYAGIFLENGGARHSFADMRRNNK